MGLQKTLHDREQGECGVVRVNVQTGTISAVELHLQAAAALGPSGPLRHFDKARRGGRGQRVLGHHMSFEVR